jgi:hypothetical protein
LLLCKNKLKFTSNPSERIKIDMNSSRGFFSGFLVGLLLILLANVIAAHLLSDCGLPAILGRSMCADDIIRAGFPFPFFEEGGFAFRHNFDSLYLLVDIGIGFGFAWICGLFTKSAFKR